MPVLDSSVRYRAPATHGEVLAVPDLTVARAAALENAKQLSQESVLIDGQTLAELRQQARNEIINEAVRWTNQLMGDSVACAECSRRASLLFVTGHQPQLAHAGVWAKNFTVAGLAKQAAGLGLNIIVDNDTAQTQAIRVPSGSLENPHFESISFDHPQPVQPWEELSVSHQEAFRSFGHRVQQAMQQWKIQPLISEMWSDAVNVADRSESLVACLSAARIAQERRWEAGNLELPLSRLCETDAFLHFTAHLVTHAAEFFGVYNRVVEAYRKENRIRNDRHPVPNLQRADDCIEMPFWYWTTGDTERGQVFVRTGTDSIELICRGQVILQCPTNDLLSHLRKLQRKGKLRTRALTTTMFSRLLLADLFVHGIGGAKYDEITDLIIAEFFGIQPPTYLVLSATMFLPVDAPTSTEITVRELEAKLRDLDYNADQYLDTPEAQKLRERKLVLLDEISQSQAMPVAKAEYRRQRLQRRQRHLAIKEVNAQLSDLASEMKEDTRQQLEEARQTAAARKILRSREYPAALFPEQEVRQLADRLSHIDQVATATS